MTAKEFLKQYEYADRRVRRLEAEYEEERIMIDAIRSTSDNDGMPHGSGTSAPTEDKAIRLADKLLELSEARLDALRIRQKVFDVIDMIEGVEGEVLYLKYIQLMTWPEVAKALVYSESGAFKLHNRALIEVEGRLKDGHYNE